MVGKPVSSSLHTIFTFVGSSVLSTQYSVVTLSYQTKRSRWFLNDLEISTELKGRNSFYLSVDIPVGGESLVLRLDYQISFQVLWTVDSRESWIFAENFL